MYVFYNVDREDEVPSQILDEYQSIPVKFEALKLLLDSGWGLGDTTAQSILYAFMDGEPPSFDDEAVYDDDED